MEISGNASGSLGYVPTIVEKAKNISEDKKVEEESDEYVDDEFDVEEEEEEKLAKDKARVDSNDMTVSASASMLPPLGVQKTQNLTEFNSNPSAGGKRDLKPADFTLNLAESQ